MATVINIKAGVNNLLSNDKSFMANCTSPRRSPRFRFTNDPECVPLPFTLKKGTPLVCCSMSDKKKAVKYT